MDASLENAHIPCAFQWDARARIGLGRSIDKKIGGEKDEFPVILSPFIYVLVSAGSP